MTIQKIGSWNGCPVFLSCLPEFSILDFTFMKCFTGEPLLILLGKLNLVYRFTGITCSQDVVREWDDGNMKPSAYLSDNACEKLLKLIGTEVDQDVENLQVPKLIAESVRTTGGYPNQQSLF